MSDENFDKYAEGFVDGSMGASRLVREANEAEIERIRSELHDETQRREQAEEELECLTMVLDDAGVPTHEGNRKLSLVGRVEKYVQATEQNNG